jgi:hypothetical protein
MQNRILPSRCARMIPYLAIMAVFAAMVSTGYAETTGQSANVAVFTSGELAVGVLRSADGIKINSLIDRRTRHELLASNNPPFFDILLRSVRDKREIHITADTGWGKAEVEKKRSGFVLRWSDSRESGLSELRVTATASADSRNSAWRWSLKVENGSSDWCIRRVVFPRLSVADPGTGSSIFYPMASGVEKQDVWGKPFSYKSTYPSGSAAMQFFAIYNHEQTPSGLYMGVHDAFGSTRDMFAESDVASKSLLIGFDTPASDMDVPGNGFEFSGNAVWRLFRGDWFDAATIYKAWVKRNAKWWPALGKDGREDTPLPVRELCVWALTGGEPAKVAPSVEAFRQYMNMPVGCHWYSWNKASFDNDYPHFLPAKDGVPETVKQMHNAGVYVMPYTNGRLWDTRDRGIEDWQFTSVAKPACTKDDDGKPYIEDYGSTDTDGSPVHLAVMCPYTDLWQTTLKDLVGRLYSEIGVDGVYMDQVAAAAPKLCMDKTHGHPVGGGHWWNDGYWKMLANIRASKPKDKFLTTECNAEPFVSSFDGLLTWHWQQDGMVPAFPAVYGGAVQMFGRAWGSGSWPTRDLAIRMKLGQELVFGEQLGWISPGIISEKENAEFLKQAAQLRWRTKRYFYAGEMARPPKLIGDIPQVKADWKWGGEHWVTTDSVLCGAWRLSRENRLVLIFVNVGSQPVTAGIRFNPKEYGVSDATVKYTELTPNSLPRKVESISGSHVFAPERAIAWELTW